MRGLPFIAICLTVGLLSFPGPFSSGHGLVPPAAAGGASIQPGDYGSTSVGLCTLSWVYDGIGDLAGRTFIGTAAHCVSHVGQTVDARGNDGFGRVAFIADACCTASDYAFVEVLPAFVDLVDASVRGHPEWPTGVTTANTTTAGEPVFYSGYGVGFSSSWVTRENRIGALVWDNEERYQVYGSALWGDSGGPITHLSGEAFGIVSRINLLTGMQLGPTVEGIVASAAEAGFTVEMRTV